MKEVGVRKRHPRMTRISLILLMSILSTLEACGVPSPFCLRMTCPGPYYREFQITDDTYSIVYMNYFMNELSPYRFDSDSRGSS